MIKRVADSAPPCDRSEASYGSICLDESRLSHHKEEPITISEYSVTTLSGNFRTYRFIVSRSDNFTLISKFFSLFYSSSDEMLR